MPDTSPWVTFERLIRRRSEAGVFRAVQLSSGTTYLAASSQDEPLFLIPTSAPTSERFSPPIRLEGLYAEFGVDCVISHDGGSVDRGGFVIVQCLSREAATRRCFVEMLWPVVNRLGSTPGLEEIRSLVEAASSLFAPRGADELKIRGLWGELLLLATSMNISECLTAWRAENAERFDFSRGASRVEVKTALGTRRNHGFSLEQLKIGDEIEVAVASLLLEKSVGGINIATLIEEVGKRLKSEEYGTFLRKLNMSIHDIGGAAEQRYDRETALASLRYIDVRDIPSIPVPLAPEISRVHFFVDVTGVKSTRASSIVDKIFT